MDGKQDGRAIISAPNLINICVDKNDGGELSGRLYHCFDAESEVFTNVVQLLNRMERFFDLIWFPQASTRSRSLVGAKKRPLLRKQPEKVMEPKDVLLHTGERGSFLTRVKYRQNADWQGEVTWMEQNVTWSFKSTLELLKILDNALM